MKKLEVKYKSQWDDDAIKAKSDCGACSLSMCLEYFGKKITTDEVYVATGETSDNGLNFLQLVAAAKSFGFTLIGTAYKSLNDLKALIGEGIPAVVVLHYGFLSNRQDTYTGGHILVVSGYDDNYIYTEDPDFAYSRRDEGHQKAYSIAEFDKAWASTLDGNYPRNLWHLVPPEGWEYKESISLKEYFKGTDTKAYKAYKEGKKKGKWTDIYDYIKQGGTPDGMPTNSEVTPEGVNISLVEYFDGKTTKAYLAYKKGKKEGRWKDLADYISQGGTPEGFPENASNGESSTQESAEITPETTNEQKPVSKESNSGFLAILLSVIIKLFKALKETLIK